MKQENAKKQISRIWDKLPNKHSQNCGLDLYNLLQHNRPDLLAFRTSDDKYQTINGWVLSWQSRDRKL